MLKNVRVSHEMRLDMSGWFSKLIVSATIRMPKWFVGWVSRRYVAGNNIDDAVKVMTRLSKENACFTIDVLGEEISTLEEANFFYEEYVRVVNAIIENKLDANLSIKPTAFGLLIDRESGFANIKKLVKMAVNDMFVRLDMEDHRVTQDTIDVVTDLHSQGLTNVGTVLQGRLFRTLDDIGQLETELEVLPITEFAREFIWNQKKFLTHPTVILSKLQMRASIECLMQVLIVQLHHMIIL